MWTNCNTLFTIEIRFTSLQCNSFYTNFWMVILSTFCYKKSEKKNLISRGPPRMQGPGLFAPPPPLAPPLQWPKHLYKCDPYTRTNGIFISGRKSGWTGLSWLNCCDSHAVLCSVLTTTCLSRVSLGHPQDRHWFDRPLISCLERSATHFSEVSSSSSAKNVTTDLLSKCLLCFSRGTSSITIGNMLS